MLVVFSAFNAELNCDGVLICGATGVAALVGADWPAATLLLLLEVGLVVAVEGVLEVLFALQT